MRRDFSFDPVPPCRLRFRSMSAISLAVRAQSESPLQGICNLSGTVTVATITQSKGPRHPPRSISMRSESAVKEEIPTPDRITETIADKLSNPATSSDFDFYQGGNQVLAEGGMSHADSG